MREDTSFGGGGGGGEIATEICMIKAGVGGQRQNTEDRVEKGDGLT